MLNATEVQKQQEYEYADIIQNKFQHDISTAMIDDSIVDYVLRCIKGPYKGKFIYINLTQEGETFGSDPNGDLTLYIESANLSPRHAKITYSKIDGQYRYLLQDLGSERGTWIKIRTDTPIQITDGLVFSVANQTYVLHFAEQEVDEVHQWLSKSQLMCLIQDFRDAKIKTLDDIKSNYAIIDKLINENTRQKFMENFEQIDNDFPKGCYFQGTLELKRIDSEEIQNIGWSGATLSSNMQDDQEYKIQEQINLESDEEIELQIKYSGGQFWLIISPESKGSCYFQLGGKQPFILSCDDVISMGNLDFLVQRQTFSPPFFVDKRIHQEIGTRQSMEDATVCIHDIQISAKSHFSIFAVFDGHGGDVCVKYISEKLIENFKEILNNYNDYDKQRHFFKYMHDIINEIVFYTDLEFYDKHKNTGKSLEQGCAATICMIVGNFLICTNIGDCRSVLSRKGQAIQLSKDHKPYLDEEKKRIIEAGGFLEFNRVNAKLGVSRTFGDFRYKKEDSGTDLLTTQPEIRVMQINYLTDEFIVLACDGLFDIYSSQECVDYVRKNLASKDITEQDPQVVAKMLCKEVVETSKFRKRHADNTSVEIVTLTRGITL